MSQEVIFPSPPLSFVAALVGVISAALLPDFRVAANETHPSPQVQETTTKRLVLIAGPIDEGHAKGTHEYQLMVRRLERDLRPLAGLLNFEIETYFNGWPEDPGALDQADTIVLASDGADQNLLDHPLLVNGRLDELKTQMDRGCGLVLLHWSLFWPERHRDLLLSWVGGYFDYETGPTARGWHSTIRHGATDYQVWNRQHPVARGVKPFLLGNEETYHKLRFASHPKTTLTPILSLNLSDGEQIEPDQVVAWAFERFPDADGRRGRGFGFTGGHHERHWSNPNQRRMVGNAVLWTAGIDPPPRGIQFPPRLDVLRQASVQSVDWLDQEKINVALVTGHQHPAHDWRQTSVAMMNGLDLDRRIAVDLIEDPEVFANPDLQDYDVVLLNYCNWGQPGLTEQAQKGLVKFLNRGGGLVLVHFSNGAFHPSLPETPDSDWPEYRKICRRVWDHAAGKSGHDAYGEFKVEIADQEHPITRGMKPFATVDELYFRQQGEAPIHVLATAKSEVTGEQEPMAMVYEYGRGRVFQTVLGHDPDSLRVPEVSQMIRRAVAWCAKKRVAELGQNAVTMDEDYLSKWTPTRRKDSRFPYENETDDDWMDDRFQVMEKGPSVSSSIKVPGLGMVPKSIAARLDDQSQLHALFDTQTLNWRTAWSGQFLTFPPNRFGVLAMPEIAGSPWFTTEGGWHWVDNKDVVTPVAAEDRRFHGHYLCKHQVVFDYQIKGTRVLDSCWTRSLGEGQNVVYRQLNFDGDDLLELPILDQLDRPFRAAPEVQGSGGEAETTTGTLQVDRAVAVVGDEAIVVTVVNGSLVMRDGYVGVRHRPATEGKSLGKNNPEINSLLVGVWRGPKALLDEDRTLFDSRQSDLRLFIGEEFAKAQHESYIDRFGAEWHRAESDSGAVDRFPARWGEPLTTEGYVAVDDAGLVVDTLTVPYENPFGALMFLSGVDFLSDGRALVSTLHGDVWLVSGIDDDLDELVWHRFATGLYQPLGLKIIDDNIYVLGRDRITRLVDLDKDGEADFYENFADELDVRGQPHGYAMSLETDPDGHFYFIKSGSSPPHGGTMLRLTPANEQTDRNRLEVFATGFRHANGLGVSPNGVISSADNEGNWMPATRIDLTKQGGFYGHMPTHWRDQDPEKYDEPLLWVPRELDNSAGGQVWVESSSWGPLKGKMLHLSYGRCSLNLVLQQHVDGIDQAAILRLPLSQFLSGSLRGRFCSNDGHLYVVGLDGWQTAAVRDGCFQRVRATGQPLNLPVELAVVKGGIQLEFSEPLDRKWAEEPSRWKIEIWNYKWSEQYGSEHYRPSEPEQFGHDAMPVRTIELSEDARTITLKTDSLAPVMQMSIMAELKSQSGVPISVRLFNTIHRVPGQVDSSENRN